MTYEIRLPKVAGSNVVLAVGNDARDALKSLGLTYNVLMSCKIKDSLGNWIDAMVVLINPEKLG